MDKTSRPQPQKQSQDSSRECIRSRIGTSTHEAQQRPFRLMLLRTGGSHGHGMRVFSQRRVLWSSTQAMHSAHLHQYSTHASVRPRTLARYAYKPLCPQASRVHCTQTKTTCAPALLFSKLPAPFTLHRTLHLSPSTMTTPSQARGHAGHSHLHHHHHHHHHDNTFLLSKNKHDAGVRITRVGLYVNLGMAVSKGFGGYVFNSQGEQPLCSPRGLH